MLEQEKMNGKTHDMGFKMYCSYGNGYRLTQDERYKEILLQAARTLATRYKPQARIQQSSSVCLEQERLHFLQILSVS